MATLLKKAVIRKCDRPASHDGRRLVVILSPGDMIGIRSEGKRTVYEAPLEKVYWVLAKWHAMEVAKQKVAEKKQRKALRAQGL